MQDMALLRPTMTVQEAAAFIGISVPTMYELTDREDFTALIRIGSSPKTVNHGIIYKKESR